MKIAVNILLIMDLISCIIGSIMTGIVTILIPFVFPALLPLIVMLAVRIVSIVLINKVKHHQQLILWGILNIIFGTMYGIVAGILMLCINDQHLKKDY